MSVGSSSAASTARATVMKKQASGTGEGKRGDAKRTLLELEQARIHLDRDEAEAVRQHFVLDDGRVVVDPHVFDGHRRDLGEENAAQCVGKGSVHADEIKHERALLRVVVDDVHLEVGHEVVDVEPVVHTHRVVRVRSKRRARLHRPRKCINKMKKKIMHKREKWRMEKSNK